MDDQIAQFTSITGASADSARTFVEAAKGDVESAVSSYFEAQEAGGAAVDNDDEAMPDAAEPAPAAAAAPAASTGPRTLSGAPAEPMPEGWGSNKSSSSGSKKKSGSASAPSRGGITGFRDLGARGDDEDEGDDDGENGDDPANFYTGGERSGLNVQNPNRGGAPAAPDVVADILRQAAQAGARGPGAEPGSLPSTGASSSFAGKGRSMADEASEAGATPAAEEEEEEEEEQETAVRHLTFWQDGFSIDDGALMRYDDPQHADTLAAINSGRAPLSLLNVAYGQPVELRVARRTNEKYTPPPPAPMKPFGGSGNRLGSPAPTIAGAGSSATPAAAPAPAAAASSSAPSAAAIDVDASQPVTQLQVRLGDGQRLAGRFNQSHTVADVRRWIDASSSTQRSYTLQASFPPKPLDESATLKDAGLINAVVIQKWS